MNERTWRVVWHWRSWTVGLIFGPLLYELRFGPLGVGYDPAWRDHLVERWPSDSFCNRDCCGGHVVHRSSRFSLWVCWRESRVDPGQICRHDRCGWAFVYPDDRVGDHRPITMRVPKEEK